MSVSGAFDSKEVDSKVISQSPRDTFRDEGTRDNVSGLVS